MNADDAKGHLVAQAKLSAMSAADKMMASAQAERLRLKRLGWDDFEIEEALRIHLSELSTGWLDRLAGQAVNVAFSMGRVVAAEDHRDEVAYATYTAILDSSVCPSCESKDG